MLPAIPAAFGNLKDVFRSAEASVLGKTNAFHLNKVDSSIVIMVDGLGFENLMQNAKSARFLSSIEQSTEVFCGFPSTTVVSLSSFATGLDSSKHGLFGYRIFDRARQESVNLLSGVDKYSILDYLMCESISETSSLEVHAVTLSDYENSGMTRATLNRAEHHFAESIGERFDIAARLAAEPNRLLYLYVPELDQAAHRYGVNSDQWRNLLSELDVAVAKLVGSIDSNIGVVLTADHGIVDVAAENHIYLDLISELDNKVLDVGGDPRDTFVYLEAGVDCLKIASAIDDYCANRAKAFTPTQLVEAGLWQPDLLQLDDLLPDLVVIALAEVAIYHRAFARPKSLKMIGQHGALTQNEIRVPLIRLGAY
jgi:predicted AlkP superfamily pyrophosphatase or phosphodiesterase